METIIEKPLLGGVIKIAITDVDETLIEIVADKIYAEGKRLEKIFNIYDKNSEITKLNQKRKLKVSKELIEVIKFGLKLSKISAGNYDISLGKKFIAQKTNKNIPNLNCSYKDILITKDQIELTNEDVLIDLGSIAKGYIVDCLVRYMKEKIGIKSGFVNARGDIKFFGNKEREVLIEHPRKKGEFIHKTKIKNAAIATSGDYKQYNKDYDHSHIIGKRDFILVSVIDKNCMVTDGLATCFMVCLEDNRKILTTNFKNSKFFCVNEELAIKYINGFK